TAKRLVTAARVGEKGVACSRTMLGSQLVDLGDMLPAIGRHRSLRVVGKERRRAARGLLRDPRRTAEYIRVSDETRARVNDRAANEGPLWGTRKGLGRTTIVACPRPIPLTLLACSKRGTRATRLRSISSFRWSTRSCECRRDATCAKSVRA